MLKNTVTTLTSILLVAGSMAVNAGSPGKSEPIEKEHSQNVTQEQSQTSQDNSSGAEVSIMEFSSFDQDSDNVITEEEFSTTYDGKEYTTEDAFSRIDLDKSGDLSEDELDSFNSENQQKWYDKLKETTDALR